MRRRPRLRKFALTAHITSSVGWLGAVVCFLALSIVGLASDDVQSAALPTLRWSQRVGSSSPRSLSLRC